MWCWPTCKTAVACSPAGDWTGWAVKDVGGDFGKILGDWKKMFPDSRIVCIVRDPFFVTRSVYRDRRRKGRRLTLRELVRAVLRQAKRKDIYIVHYEALVAETETWMRRLADFLEVSFTSSLTQPTLFGKPAVVKTASRRQTNVFRDSSAYWRGLTARELLVLSIVGGACRLRHLVREMARRRARFLHRRT